MSTHHHDLRTSFEAVFHAYIHHRYHTDRTLDEAIRYVLSGSGKRVRPTLAMLAAEAAGGPPARALPAAIALEFIHTYSLTHDDLPCMDDDDLRRGRPTAHKQFDEATALLVGDALLTDAFTLLAQGADKWLQSSLSNPHTTSSQILTPETLTSPLPAPVRLEQVTLLAKAAGGGGMVAGQALDLHWTRRSGASKADLDEIHLHKTGALIGAACALGALSGGASSEQAREFLDFGYQIGLAFQITDDLLDDTTTTGKTQGKDKNSGKLTYTSLMSIEQAQAEAEKCTQRALQIMLPYGEAATPLKDYVCTLLKRQY